MSVNPGREGHSVGGSEADRESLVQSEAHVSVALSPVSPASEGELGGREEVLVAVDSGLPEHAHVRHVVRSHVADGEQHEHQHGRHHNHKKHHTDTAKSPTMAGSPTHASQGLTAKNSTRGSSGDGKRWISIRTCVFIAFLLFMALLGIGDSILTLVEHLKNQEELKLAEAEADVVDKNDPSSISRHFANLALRQQHAVSHQAMKKEVAALQSGSGAPQVKSRRLRRRR